MTPSPYQEAIYTALRTTSANLQIEAVAGSGKTTTLVQAFSMVPAEDAIFLAFNSSVADELRNRGVKAKTLHSLGYQICMQNLGFCKSNDKKLRNLYNYTLHNVEKMTTAEKIDNALAFQVVEQAVALLKSWAVPPSQVSTHLQTLVDHYDLDVPYWLNLEKEARSLLELSLATSRVVDFDDMLYWPVMYPTWQMPKFRTIFIDEAQDISHVQRKFIERILAPGGRIIVVGDSAQAIYGFRGAASDSMALFQQTFQTKLLPLSICYRCGSDIVAQAKRLVPAIEPWDQSPHGLVITNPDFTAYKPGDMVICRNVQPLIELATTLLKSQPVKLEYPELIQSLLDDCAKIRKSYGQVNLRSIREHGHKMYTYYLDKGFKRKAQAHLDRMAIIRTIAERQEDFVEHVLQIDLQSSGGVRLLSIHKAKGLEANRVILLRKDLLPSPQAKAEWELTQERNLEYVAITRAKQELIYA